MTEPAITPELVAKHNLTPEEFVHAQEILGVGRHASAEDFLGVDKFFRREVVFGNQLWGDGGFGHFSSKFLNP